MPRAISHNILYLGTAQVFSKALIFIFFSLTGRILGPENFGKFAYLLNLIIVLDVVIDYGMTPFMVRSIARNKSKNASLFLNSLVIKYAVATICGTGMFLYGSQIEPDPDKQNAVKYVILILFTWPVYNSVISVFQAYERQDLYGIMYIVRNALLLAITYLLLLLEMGVSAPLAGHAAAALLAAAAGSALISLRFFTFSGYEKSEYTPGNLIEKGFPFFLSTLTAAFFIRIDVFLLTWLRGDIETGWYSASQKIVEGLQFVPIVVSNTVFPVLSRISSIDHNRFIGIYRKSMKLLLLFIVPAACFITFAAKDIIGIMYGQEFSESIIALQLLVWVLVPNFLNYINLFALYARNRQNQVIAVICAGFIVKAALTLLLVPQYGYVWSCLIGIISECFLLTGYMFFGRRLFAPGFPVFDGMRIILASAAMVAILIVINSFTPLWIQIPAAVLSYGLFVFTFRALTLDELKALTSNFRPFQNNSG